ncbi:MAG: immunoglobulin domain-containing protein [Opitutaceae bacterium]|nr:immunoglobulin domain-containing protein [Opitutaceae bacterium]
MTETLRVQPLTAERSGTRFRCIASNAAGSMASESAEILLVAAPPTIFGQPADSTIAVGDRLGLGFSAFGLISPVFQWYQNGEPIPDGTDQTLTITAVTEADAGTYYVRITDVGGVVESASASVTVVPASAVASVSAGADYTLFIQANGVLRVMGANDYGQTGGVSDPASSIVSQPQMLTTNPGYMGRLPARPIPCSCCRVALRRRAQHLSAGF